MILVAVVVMGILVEAATVQTSRIQQAEREAELLFRGMAYRAAIRSYYESGKPIKTFPKSLDDLVKDPRAANRHHLRALYSDPMTHGKGEWVLTRAADGGISRGASRSSEVPFKRANFPPGLERFISAKSYSDWLFDYQPDVRLGIIPVQSPGGIPASSATH